MAPAVAMETVKHLLEKTVRPAHKTVAPAVVMACVMRAWERTVRTVLLTAATAMTRRAAHAATAIVMKSMVRHAIIAW